MEIDDGVGFASALRARDELLAQHVELVAKRLQGTLAAHRALTELARQIRDNDLPTIVVEEPGPEVRTVLDERGDLNRSEMIRIRIAYADRHMPKGWRPK